MALSPGIWLYPGLQVEVESLNPLVEGMIVSSNAAGMHAQGRRKCWKLVDTSGSSKVDCSILGFELRSNFGAADLTIACTTGTSFSSSSPSVRERRCTCHPVCTDLLHSSFTLGVKFTEDRLIVVWLSRAFPSLGTSCDDFLMVLDKKERGEEPYASA